MSDKPLLGITHRGIKPQWLVLPQPEPEPEPEPVATSPPVVTPPAAEIPKPIRTGAAPFYVLVITDDGGVRWPGGKPIVWEHPVPETTGLRDVLQKQVMVGGRYGTTYVAECRIIPELTRDA